MEGVGRRLRTHCQVGPVPLNQVSQAVQQPAPVRCVHAAPGRAQPEGSPGSHHCPVHVLLEDTAKAAQTLSTTATANTTRLLPHMPRVLRPAPVWEPAPNSPSQPYRLCLASCRLLSRSHRRHEHRTVPISVFSRQNPSKNFGGRGTPASGLRM